MNSFLHIPQVFNIIKSSNDIIGPTAPDSVCYSYLKSGHSISVGSSLLPDNSISGNTSGVFKLNDFDFVVKATTSPSIFCYIHKSLLNNKLDTATTLASRSHKHDGVIPPHAKGCIASFSSKYFSDEFSIHGFLGLKNNNSISTLCSVADTRASVALRGFVTDKTNILEASFLSTKFGPFASIRGDVSSIVLQKIKIGGMKNIKNNTDFYGLIELVERSVRFGLVSKLPDSVNVALSGGYNHSKREPKLTAGFEVTRIGKFCGKANINGTIEMRATFDPNNYVTITLRSETSVKNKFNPINFGWSLDFKSSEEKE